MSTLMKLASSLGNNQVAIGGNASNALSNALKMAMGNSVDPITAKLKEIQLKTAQINQSIALKRLKEDDKLAKELQKLKLDTERQRLANAQLQNELTLEQNYRANQKEERENAKYQAQLAEKQKKEAETQKVKNNLMNMQINPITYNDVQNKIGDLNPLVTEQVDEVTKSIKPVEQDKVEALKKQMNAELYEKDNNGNFVYKYKYRIEPIKKEEENTLNNTISLYNSIDSYHKADKFTKPKLKKDIENNVKSFIGSNFNIDENGKIIAKNKNLQYFADIANKNIKDKIIKHKMGDGSTPKSISTLIPTVNQAIKRDQKNIIQSNQGTRVQAYSLLKDAIINNPTLLKEGIKPIYSKIKHNQEAQNNLNKIQLEFANKFAKGKIIDGKFVPETEDIKTGNKTNKLVDKETALSRLRTKVDKAAAQYIKDKGITNPKVAELAIKQFKEKAKLEEDRVKNIYAKIAAAKAAKQKELEEANKIKNEIQKEKAKEAIKLEYDKKLAKYKSQLKIQEFTAKEKIKNK